MIIVSIGGRQLRIALPRPQSVKPRGGPPEESRMIGERIKRARLGRGLTQASLAAAINAPCARIAAYERGSEEPGLTTFVDLARVLGVPPATLAFDPAPNLALAGFPGDHATIPVFQSIDQLTPASKLGLPAALLENRVRDPRLCAAYQLDRDAPAFSLRAGDHVVVDTGIQRVQAGHDRYLLRAGERFELVRIEPNFVDNALIRLSGDHRRIYQVPEGALSIVGAVILTFNRC